VRLNTEKIHEVFICEEKSVMMQKFRIKLFKTFNSSKFGYIIKGMIGVHRNVNKLFAKFVLNK
jgi:hypothetical protein